MLQDEVITLDLVEELDIEIREIDTKTLTFDGRLDSTVVIDLESDFVVIVDLESLGPIVIDDLGRYGKIQKIFQFGRSVVGRKKTFGKISFPITNTIRTIGTPDINPANHNLVNVPLVFSRSVLGKKTTFGKVSLDIVNNIQITGINSMGDVRFYGGDLYGAGIYGDAVGYGVGAYGFGIYAGDAISLKIIFGSVIKANIPYKQTSVGEISLASHGTPGLNTDHRIILRARTTSGSTGVIRAALYEGTINRSGDLETPPLTNSLVEYELNIPVEVASEIIDYSNLSIRFQGFSLSGIPLTFEIADLKLKLPVETGGIQYGSISRQITFGRTVSGSLSSKSTAIAEISLGPHAIPYEFTNHSIKVRARTVSGSTGVLKVALYEGTINRSGDLITPVLNNVLTEYKLIIFDYLSATISDFSNLSIKFWGFDINGNALVFEVSRIYLELPISTGNVTQYGVISRQITFGRTVSGSIITKSTATAEISLASHGTPSGRTNHSIKIRARTLSGSSGVIRAQLYEGATLRSGATPLQSSALINSLADYSLAIPDAAAATITNYSNLSIKFWGHDSAGNALVFEVSQIYLELPTT